MTTAIDFKNKYKVFLAHPVSDYQASSGIYRPEKKEFISRTIEALRNLDFEIECAALNENYGGIKLEPEEFTLYDIEAIARCNVFVLITSERITKDMYLEIGLACAQKKPVHLFIPFSAYRRHATYMIIGLQSTGTLNIVTYDSEDDVPSLITENLGIYCEEQVS